MRYAAEYILPLKWTGEGPLAELARYLADLVQWIDVTVVDGSPAPIFAGHARAFPPGVRHLPPDPGLVGGGNGKVHGVLTGLSAARHDLVVIADDDVRYRRPELARLLELLEQADIVRPQNYFAQLPWHARWDTGRSLLNRAAGSDYPGTLGVRRSTVLSTGGYCSDALFENLELIRTVRAAGGREIRADDLFVARLPCSSRHFLKQRVRQAYDSFAQPGRLAIELGLLPAVVLARPEPRYLALAGLAVVALAETGRRRRGGRTVFRPTAALWAPAWVLERAVCSWLAVASRARGGVRYAGGRMLLAAHSERHLRSHLAQRVAPMPHAHPIPATATAGSQVPGES
ncbi:glycosyltransferase [Arthrobacter sp. NamB2]|uniref:glycosyltransferase n=1 Tax=Arthrobacter sp. NamB2 TaxID=2576035 RepID=UPI0010C93C0C|nr:glycosyltransferase [Arthrobacter sp. NamB2]TKV29881.1 glycosyltransferase [Arthrobacter sp. NamB2]